MLGLFLDAIAVGDDITGASSALCVEILLACRGAVAFDNLYIEILDDFPEEILQVLMTSIKTHV